MDGSSFDRITRRLAVTTSRRGGVAALVAGALGIAGISAAEAVVPIPPTCLATNAICTDGAQCCSGRCIAKRLKNGGGSRCARKTSNRKKKKEEEEKEGDSRCIRAGSPCPDVTCCGDSYCNPDNQECCVRSGFYCNQTSDCCGTSACVNNACLNS